MKNILTQLENAMTLADIFEVAKIVLIKIGKSRGGLMLGMAAWEPS